MKSFEIKTKIHFGDHALERLSQMPYKRVLVITDPFIAKGPLLHLITEPLERAGKVESADWITCIAICVVCICEAFSYWNQKRILSYIAIAGAVFLIAVMVLLSI